MVLKGQKTLVTLILSELFRNIFLLDLYFIIGRYYGVGYDSENLIFLKPKCNFQDYVLQILRLFHKRNTKRTSLAERFKKYDKNIWGNNDNVFLPHPNN